MLGAVAAITFIPEAGALFGRTTETAGALRIEGDADRHLLASGNELLQVTGRITNLTREVQPIPQIRAALRDAKGRVVSRSEARRVGKECVSTCRSRGSPYH